jgi:hypothetical protein
VGWILGLREGGTSEEMGERRWEVGVGVRWRRYIVIEIYYFKVIKH